MTVSRAKRAAEEPDARGGVEWLRYSDRFGVRQMRACTPCRTKQGRTGTVAGSEFQVAWLYLGSAQLKTGHCLASQ